MATSDNKARKTEKAGKGTKAEQVEEADELPKARVVERDVAGDARPASADPLRMIRIGGFLVALIGGWLFILAQNRFDPTPPVVFVGLGYLALVSAIYALWRTGVVVADENEDNLDATRPVGARGELEREKKSLLKAIKETEFDREMGKLSKDDADQMIKVYRSRAIEVLKALEIMENPAAAGEGTVREPTAREVKARL
ncbi:MAG: hypothetical protein SFX73_20200, partial [Kofleriaceae bacterium]|nr:hypothetical protein [Kofleriaceae bacterium]